MLSILRRMLLRLGYALPLSWQRWVWGWLYNGPPPGDEENERLQITVVQADQAELPIVLTLQGGCRHAETVRDPLARLCYWEAHHGQLGARFQVAAESAVDSFLAGTHLGPVPQDEYEITEHRVINGVRYLSAQACTPGKGVR